MLMFGTSCRYFSGIMYLYRGLWPERLIEALVHLELSPERLPRFYRLLQAEVPGDLSVRDLNFADLPRKWTEDQIATRTIGDEWLVSRTTVLLRVPSAIIPETFNILLNPEHPDARRVLILWNEQYPGKSGC